MFINVHVMCLRAHVWLYKQGIRRQRMTSTHNLNQLCLLEQRVAILSKPVKVILLGKPTSMTANQST